MLFAFQRFAAIVLDGETTEVAEPVLVWGDHPEVATLEQRLAVRNLLDQGLPMDAAITSVLGSATSSDDVPHDAPAPETPDAPSEPETPAGANEPDAADQGAGEDGVPGLPESDPAEPEEPVPATEAQPDPLTEAAP
jgi:hypothetical protein